MQQLSFETHNRTDNFHSIERTPIRTLDELSIEKTKALFSWWSSFNGRPAMRDDFDIVKMPHLAPNIYLIQVVSPTKFLYRLCGEDVGHLIGRQYRMHEISVTCHDIEDSLLANYLITLLDLKGPCRCRGNLKVFDNEFIDFESVDLPLVDENGNITHFVGVLDRLE